MTTRHPSLASTRRPSSAIYIGDGLPSVPSPPSPAHPSSSKERQLPSPPASNSTGSTGDSNSTSAGSVGRAGMSNGKRQSSLSDDEDDHDLDHDEDDTAKLSNDRRISKGKQPDYESSTLQRVKSLTERNRKVIDKLSSITSDTHRSSLSTPSGPSSTRSRSPLPPALSSSSSSSTASTHSRVSFEHNFRGGSGSETEREQRPTDRRHPVLRDKSNSLSSEDDDAATPPSSARGPTPTSEHADSRQRLTSAPPSPVKLPSGPAIHSPRKQTSTTFTVIGSGRRSRRVSIQQPPDSYDDEDGASSPTAGGSVNKRSRAPLPREFRDRRSFDGRTSGGSSSTYLQERENTTSPGVLVARGSASPHSSGAGGTFSTTPASPRTQRPARPSTVRETSKRVQRWSSVDDDMVGGVSPRDEEGRRQWRHTGSAESPLGVREGRSVVGEGLRAAGLTRRGSEDVFVDGIPQRRTRLSGGLGNRPTLNGRGNTELDELRRGIVRVGLGLPEAERNPRTPQSASGSSRFGTARNTYSVQSGASSRAATSLATYGADEEGPRTVPPQLRSHRSTYVLPERTSSRHTPQHERSRTSPAVGRSTPQHATTTPSSEHARLMLDSLAMFESQLGRLPPAVPDLLRSAQSVVQSANGLNALLRAGNAHALESQIEAEVGDAATQVDASEVWRQVGGEYRESLRVSDELVRTITALLLGVGRLVREAVKERGPGSPDQGGGGGGSGRSSLDGDDRERDRAVRGLRRSLGGEGRNGIEGSLYRESRRSWDEVDGSQRGRIDLNTRPSTSLSMTRDRDRSTTSTASTTLEDRGETVRERERSSTLERLSMRRIFTPRSRETNSSISHDSPDATYPSPSPAPRSSLEWDHRDRNREYHHRSLPPLSVPPPLPSLPSESLLERKSSGKGRRSKFSNTSNATVRGTSIFPSLNTPNPTTALTPHTVSAAGEVTAFPLLRGDSLQSGALSGLQQQQQRDERKRTTSTTSTRDLEVGSGSSESSGTRALRNARVRMSLDSAEVEPPTQSPPERRERRRTINEIFS